MGKPNPQQGVDRRKWVESLLVSAEKRDWFGSITVEFKRGQIDLVRCEETLKPPAGKNVLPSR